jgi:NitT/TauT family transport system substrate-binding protein
MASPLALARSLIALGVLAATPALAADKLVFGTNWKAQAEHGGYYYAVAEGIYARHGLDVEIRQGGPSINHTQLLAAGRVDFNMGGNTDGCFHFVQAGIPLVCIGAIFQKDPQVIISHPGVGNDSLAQLKGKPMMIGQGGRLSFWQWLKLKYGYSDDQLRPYNFNPGPFLADRQANQQGYITSEPFAVETQGGFKPVLHLLADHGYDAYSTLIETSWKLVNEKPDLVQRFVDATILGWKGYFEGDRARTHALIKKDNPEITDGQLDYSVKAMQSYGIVMSGDALRLGIGAMTEERITSYFRSRVELGQFPANLDIRKAYTLRFVNKRVGLN